jgi:hypothetical protein
MNSSYRVSLVFEGIKMGNIFWRKKSGLNPDLIAFYLCVP